MSLRSGSGGLQDTVSERLAVASTGLLVLDLSGNKLDGASARRLLQQLVHDRWLLALSLRFNAGLGRGAVHLLASAFLRHSHQVAAPIPAAPPRLLC